MARTEDAEKEDRACFGTRRRRRRRSEEKGDEEDSREARTVGEAVGIGGKHPTFGGKRIGGGTVFGLGKWWRAK